jgi:hypothetical protein
MARNSSSKVRSKSNNHKQLMFIYRQDNRLKKFIKDFTEKRKLKNKTTPPHLKNKFQKVQGPARGKNFPP